MRGTGSGAGASAWARYRALSAEYRMERVAARLVLAAAAGAVAFGLAGAAGWWAGPTVLLSVFAAHTVYVRQRPDAVNGWRQGALAERRTGRRLAALDPAAYRVMHDRALPQAPAANLDHLVIGLTGVYAIVSRRFPVRTSLRADQRRVWAGDRPLVTLPAAAARAARTVAEELAAELDHEVRVTAMVAVHGGRLPRGGLRQGRVLFQPVRRLSAYIKSRPVVFSNAQVATIAAAAERRLPPMPEIAPYRRQLPRC